MNTSAIAWRNLRVRPLQTALTTLIIALGVGLAITVVVVAAGLQRGLTEAGGPFEIVVGPKGSATQLVLSSVLLQDIPLGNISYAQYEQLATDERVSEAIPLALGDNVAGLRIIGTTLRLFQTTIVPGDPPFYRVVRGRPFNGSFEAVLGSTAAERLGLDLDAQLISAHGVIGGPNEAGHRSFPYRVVGILAPTGTPADLGVYVPISSYWEVHGASEATIATPGGSLLHSENNQALNPGVTAVLVRARTISASYQLYQEINSSTDLQAALPGAVLTQFLNLLGQGQRLLMPITFIALIMAGLSVAGSLYGAVLAQQRDLAVLRALGAGRITIIRIIFWQATLQALLGIISGALLGYAAATAIAIIIARQSAIAVPLQISANELMLLAGMLFMGLIAGLLPTLRAYQVEPAKLLADRG